MAFYINGFIVGGMQSSLGIVRTEGELVERLQELRDRIAE
jgi:hypothetical protein